ncbi:MAG: hypothetical protein Pg6C_19870 [Treponemataceae bacterium]|nr:MAG: hypothetical protein Pg6C_19870 [Treponemataceae bacterium]
MFYRVPDDAKNVRVFQPRKPLVAALKVVNEGMLTVALDSEITGELKKEGFARDLIRGVQNLRKSSGLEVTDRIALTVSGSAELKAAFEAFSQFVANETLASHTAWADSLVDGAEAAAGDETWRVKIEKR